MSERILKTALIGIGLQGELHALTYANYHRSQLTLICDANEARVKAAASRFHCDYTTDLREVASADVDAVSIATPDFAHLEPALAMLGAGKHVLIEKPLAMELGEARRIVAAAKTAGVRVMTCQSNRWNPKVQAARQAFQNEQLGPISMGYCRLNDPISVPAKLISWAARSGPHWFLFPHTIDVVRWLIGQEAVSVYAAGTRGVLENLGVNTWDAVQAVVRFERACVTFEANWILPTSFPRGVDYRIFLSGAKGAIDLDIGHWGVELSGPDRFQVVATSAQRRLDFDGTLVGQSFDCIRHFVDCALEDRPPLVSLDDSLAVTAIIAAIEQSLRERSEVTIDAGA